MVSVVHQVVFVYQRKISQKTHSQHWHKELHRATVVVLEDRRSTWKWPTAIDLTVPNSKFQQCNVDSGKPKRCKQKSANNNGISCEKRRLFFIIPYNALVCLQSNPQKLTTYLYQKLIILWSERTQLHISFEYYIPWNPDWFKRGILISWLTK